MRHELAVLQAFALRQRAGGRNVSADTGRSDKWIAPGMESPDPLKEINAFRAEVALGVRSPQEIAARRGRDYDEVVDEIAEAKTKAESKGLGFGDIFTAPGGLNAEK